MPTDYKGKTFTQIRDSRFDNSEGLQWVYRERGIPSVIEGRANGWVRSGYDVLVRGTGPYRELTAYRTFGGGFYGWIERWTVSTETLEKPLWSLPAVKAEADAFTYTDPDGETVSGPAQYKKGIEEAVNNGDALGAAYSGLTAAAEVHRELSRGVQGYEHDYTVLERDISIDWLRRTNITVSFTLSKLIFTTDQLRANENIPDNIYFSLPASDGPSDVQAMWGWRARDQEADIDVGVSRKIRTSWVYANWSTFLYTPA